MHDKIPDFTDTKLWVIRQAESERFRKEVELQQADAELRLDIGECVTILLQVQVGQAAKSAANPATN